MSIKRLPNGSRGEETVNNKTQIKHKVRHFYFYFCPKLECRTYFVYFHTFSYKFKVQRTPTEFGPPVTFVEFSNMEIHKLITSQTTA